MISHLWLSFSCQTSCLSNLQVIFVIRGWLHSKLDTYWETAVTQSSLRGVHHNGSWTQNIHHLLLFCWTCSVGSHHFHCLVWEAASHWLTAACEHVQSHMWKDWLHVGAKSSVFTSERVKLSTMPHSCHLPGPSFIVLNNCCRGKSLLTTLLLSDGEISYSRL